MPRKSSSPAKAAPARSRAKAAPAKPDTSQRPTEIVLTKEMLEEAAAVKVFLAAADHYFAAAVANAHDPERVESLKPVYLKMEKAWAAMRLFRLPKNEEQTGATA